MSTIGQKEIETQRRVIEYIRDELGYTFVGSFKDRGHVNVEMSFLRSWLHRQGWPDQLITRAEHALDQARAITGSKHLYQANQEVYRLLRYGVKVSPGPGEHHQTVWLIDWKHPENNEFAIAEEVTVTGENTKRLDLVLYINGIALVVIELKRSTVSVGEGIRQSLDNQKRDFIRPFFSTVQLVMAGNDSEGLRYSVIETPEKYWLAWKEDGGPENPLLRALGQMCNKDRLLEIIHDFIVFDAGIKKTCRHNQYFGVRAAQEYARRHDGGIIWHTQGSGKSLTMVWLAKWIRENIQGSRVLIITDRTELDDQIETVFKGVEEQIYRAKNGADLIQTLNEPTEWLMASLIHKFDTSAEDGDVDEFLSEIAKALPSNFAAKGELFVFVAECHRTQSGSLHQAMKTLLPDATLIGFTGTPLLKKDRQKSIEVFGPFIHTYKYDEAVRDRVVLDLRYEARDIDQNITSPAKIDKWFEAKTHGLNDYARSEIKKRWGTMQKVLSSEGRLGKIADDILMDMETRDRLRSGHGNAILVTSSIYSACRIFELFQNTPLAGKCAIVTSYRPSPNDIKGEETGEGLTEKLRQYEIYRRMLARHFDESEESAAGKAELFEKEIKWRFINEPGQMKLLIVVDKLLTGFDAPPATYLYIDKQMRDHALFQAICRVNRLDGDDKEYGYIVDYKDLFHSLEESIADYTSGAFDDYDADDVAGLLENRLDKGRQRLEEAREGIKALCERVEPPRDSDAYRHYFCAADTTDPDSVKDNEPRRLLLYKLTAALVRAYANLANEMAEAGYSQDETTAIKAEAAHFDAVRKEVMLASGDYVDLKQYEPAMRHLLDAYIRAEDSEQVSAFSDMTLVELIVERGAGAIDVLPAGMRENSAAVAETIENNVRRVIIDEMSTNPAYYEQMSTLLDSLIQARRKSAIDYKVYLEQIIALSRQISNRESSTTYPEAINTDARRALYDNTGSDVDKALRIDAAVREKHQDSWRGNMIKEREVMYAIQGVLDEGEPVEPIFEIVQAQYEY